MRLPRRVRPLATSTLISTLAAAALFAAAPAAAMASGELARLEAPASGATLVGGATVALAWEPGPGLAPLRAVEWEAFLSLDGGRHFAVRLTPHLDIAVRRVLVRVPAVPAADVRLLLRFGDERDEHELALAHRYRIVVAEGGAAVEWRRRIPGAGEPGRRGAAGVLLWVEGDRSGSRWQEVEGSGEGPSCGDSVRQGGERRLAISRVRASAPRAARPLASRLLVLPTGEDGGAVAGADARTVDAALLALHCRRNV